MRCMSSDNSPGADNQQETESPAWDVDPMWIAGFVDGEGCFSISIHRNPYVKLTRGWQVQACFQVTQHQTNRHALDALRAHFGCGRVVAKGPRSSVLTFTVWTLRERDEIIVPFFETHELMVKRGDFMRFASIVRSMRRKEHLSPAGFERVVRLAYAMNANGKQRARPLQEVLGGSSETARQAPSVRAVKVQSDPHGDMGSQAEMI